MNRGLLLSKQLRSFAFAIAWLRVVNRQECVNDLRDLARPSSNEKNGFHIMISDHTDYRKLTFDLSKPEQSPDTG